MPSTVERFLEFDEVRLFPGIRCGTGRVAKRHSDPGCGILCLEVSNDTCVYARRKHGLDILQGDMFSNPLRSIVADIAHSLLEAVNQADRLWGLKRHF